MFIWEKRSTCTGLLYTNMSSCLLFRKLRWSVAIPPPPSQSDSIRVCKKNNIVGLRGCLHGKTCTGASFIPGWLRDFGIMMTGNASVFLSSHVQRVEADKAILVCLQTDFTPKRVVVSRLHDTVAKSHTGVKFSPRCENRGELTPGRLALAWHFVVVPCKQI